MATYTWSSLDELANHLREKAVKCDEEADRLRKAYGENYHRSTNAVARVRFCEGERDIWLRAAEIVKDSCIDENAKFDGE